MRPAVNQKAAKKRIRRFFDEPVNERRHVSTVIERISKGADVFVFGGALRDISLMGSPYFCSDVDIVVKAHDMEIIHELFSELETTKNKFGGHRVHLGRWTFDVWEIDRTWAFKVGAVEARSHLSLLETTFFNWDAILYNWRLGSLHHGKNYFSELSEKYLELVLEQNPNSLGALVRSLRTMSLSDEIVAGPKLSRFVKSEINSVSINEILSYEEHSFSANLLTKTLIEEFRARSLDWDGESKFRWVPKRQLCFWDKFEAN